MLDYSSFFIEIPASKAIIVTEERVPVIIAQQRAYLKFFLTMVSQVSHTVTFDELFENREIFYLV